MIYDVGQLVFWLTHTSGTSPMGIIIRRDKKKDCYTIMWTSKENSGILTVGAQLLEAGRYFYVLTKNSDESKV
tara:strand:+ start:705 stop:923 length:219 start_codon:yes stop_codon:yes gene_type:complete